MSSVPATLKIEDLKCSKVSLHAPPMEEVARILNEKLKPQFQDVDVAVVDCPDLTEAPFHLASKGLCGSPTIGEVGGVVYLLPQPKKEKIYDFKEIAKALDLDPCFIVGAGAAPWPHLGTNAELTANIKISKDGITNLTRIARIDPETKNYVQQQLPQDETRFCLLLNIYCSEGKPGKVLKIHCKKRIGEEANFITSIRKILQSQYNGKPVGLGGVFLIKEGKAHQHVMPDFSKEPLNSDQELEKWLHFFDMKAPIIALGTLITSDPGLDLRVQHFHSFSQHGDAGHYHYDVTPEEVEYLAYFGIGENLLRVDQSEETSEYGKD